MTEDVKLQRGRGQTVVLLSNCMLRYRRKEIYRGGNPPLFKQEPAFSQTEKQSWWKRL